MMRERFRSMYHIAAFIGGAVLMAWIIFMLVGCGTKRVQLRRSSEAEVAASALERVYFDTDSDLLDDEALATLSANQEWLERHARAVLVLEGHCDERGDSAYNLQLGDRRARRVKGHLIKAGIDPERLIMVVSHGEQRPLDPRHRVSAWRLNRRVEFIIR